MIDLNTHRAETASDFQDDATVSWRPIYWAFAAIIPVVLFSFDALKIVFFDVSRAPNVGLSAQLTLLAAIYALWVFAPRLCWTMAPKPMPRGLLLIAAAGLLLSYLHLTVFALILRIMYSPPGWGALHVLQSSIEVWIANAGVWFTAYALAAGVILVKFRQTDQPSPAPITRYEVRDNGKTRLIPVAQVYWIAAAGNYVEMHTENGVLTVRKTLSEVENELSGAGFFRTHRSAIVNSTHVQSIKPVSGDGYLTEMTNGDQAPLSRRKLAAFKKMMKFDL